MIMRIQTLTKQSRRMLEYALAMPNTDISQPELNRAAAGDRIYVNSFSKRVSECRAEMQRLGGDFILSRDEWKDSERRTWYRLIPAVQQFKLE